MKTGCNRRMGYQSNKLMDGEVFRKHVLINTLDDPGCWEWQGTIGAKGYGRVGRNQWMYIAHRFAYELLVGPIPPGKQLDHLCRNHRCVNPSHLEPVDNRTNVLRGISPLAIYAKMTHCQRGHEFSGSNLIMRKEGGRRCRTCRDDKNKRRKHVP